VDDLSLQSYWPSERIIDVSCELQRVLERKQTLLFLRFVNKSERILYTFRKVYCTFTDLLSYAQMIKDNSVT
jgi:hypothetical protein